MTNERPRVIALISEHASPLGVVGGVDAGGQNVYVAQLARRLAARGHRVDVFTRRDRPDLPEVVECDGYRVVHVAAGPARFVRKEDLLPHIPRFIEQTARFVARQPRRYDVVHANFFMSGMVAAELKRRFGIPFVVTFHALGKVRRHYQGPNDQFPTDRLGIEERLVAEADRIIAECPQDEIDLISLYAADPARITMIPCGYDPEECHPVDRAEARERLGLPQDAPVVLQLGRLVPRKGVDNVVQAFACLRQQFPDAVLAIAGGESDQPDPEATPEIGRLQAIAAAQGVADAVRFVGRRPRAELGHCYSAADDFVTTPWYEPFGITPVEAMACGTPVVGARVGGIQYTVVDGVTGLLVPPRDPAALAAALARILADPEVRARYAANGRKRAAELFTWDRVADAVADLYDEVAAERARPRPEEAQRIDIVNRGFDDLVDTLLASRSRLAEDVMLLSKLLTACFRQGGKVLVCGNGGSAADAQHFATELVGRFRAAERRALPVVALPADVSSLTAWANDVGYEHVFARQVQAYARPGDLVLGISTSGRSQNVIEAFHAARERGVGALALLGGDGGALLPLATAAVVVPSTDTQRIQEVHGLLIHLLCELVERDLAIAEPAAEVAS